MLSKSVEVFLAVAYDDDKMSVIKRQADAQKAWNKANGFAIATCGARDFRLRKEDLRLVTILLCEVAKGARDAESAVQYLWLKGVE